jgi:cell division protein ZapA
MNRVTVKINGIEYNLKGKEDGKYLLDVAGYVDGKFREISANNSKLGTSSVAVLAALNIADELFKCDLEIEEITKKKNSLEERHLTLKERLRELKEDIDQSAKERINEVESLKKIIYSMEEKISEVQKLQGTIVQLNEKVLEGEKYKSEAIALQKQLELSEHENTKLKEIVKDLENQLGKSIAKEEFKSVSMDLLKVQKENTMLITENQNLKQAVEEFSVKCKEAEVMELEYKETEEELRKIIMVKKLKLKILRRCH